MQQKELSCIKAENIQSSPFAYTLKIIGGKYKMGILYALTMWGEEYGSKCNE